MTGFEIWNKNIVSGIQATQKGNVAGNFDGGKMIKATA